MRLVERPAGPAGRARRQPVLLLCSNNYLGLADHPRVREAAADAAMRWGAGAGASRLVCGHDDRHRRLEERAGRVQGPRGGAAVRLRLPRQHRRHRPRSPAAARSSSPTSSTTRQHHRRLPPRARRDVRLPPRRRRAPRLGPAAGGRPRLADRHRRASSRWTATSRRWPSSSSWRSATACGLMVDEAHATGCVGPGGRGAVAAAGLEQRGRRRRRHARQGARLLRRLRRRCDAEMATLPGQHRPPVHLLDRAAAARGRGARWRRWSCSIEQPRLVEQLQANADVLRTRARRRGLRGRRLDHADRPADRRRRDAGDARLRGARSSAASSPRRSGRRPCPRAPRACGWR